MSESNGMEQALDLCKLEKMRSRGGKTIARCPACAENGGDAKGEHLFISADGRFGCVQNPGDEGRQHRSKIFELVGIRRERSTGKSGITHCDTLEEAIIAVAGRLKMAAVRRDWYYEKDGSKHFVIVRFESEGKKDFRPFHRGPGGWEVKDPAGKLPLFNLPALLRRPAESVFVTEGEKCSCELGTLKVLATTSAHGAKSPHKTDWSPLAGRDVVILPDNDEEGLSYARKVQRILGELTPQPRVIVLQLPGLPRKGDCVEWLAARDAQLPEDILAELESLVNTDGNSPPAAESATGWGAALAKSVISSSELGALSLQPRRKFLGEFFAEGDLAFLVAARGVGKTWLAMLFARALAEGISVGPWEAHGPVKVLYVDGEMPADLIQARDRGLAGGPGEVAFLNHEILFDRTQKVLNIAEAEVQQAITSHCLATGTKVVFLDNLSTLASGIKENDSFAWEPIANWLLQFRRHKIAVVVIHHAGRSGEARGTTKREDAAFWVMTLDDARKHSDDPRGARFISRFTKPSRNTQEEIAPYEWHFVTDPVSGIVAVSCKAAQSLDVFRRLVDDGVTSCADIASEMRISTATVSRMAKKAIDAGWLEKAGREYRLLENG